MGGYDITRGGKRERNGCIIVLGQHTLLLYKKDGDYDAAATMAVFLVHPKLPQGGEMLRLITGKGA